MQASAQSAFCSWPRKNQFTEKNTIYNLREENAYLHHRLKNLTQTLQELRKLLDHSHESAVKHDSDKLHAWNEWIKNGITTETHLMLEQAFCLPDLHASANFDFLEKIILVMSGLLWIGILLI
ncbi:hypothetical protein QQF64_027464 [Cirrhinus molitorella]|uniref:Uncharacterized protein n=1 Tax=Cirrhinus molitorella TaxID=172907 RepID=A0ABR3NCG3_9TELE